MDWQIRKCKVRQILFEKLIFWDILKWICWSLEKERICLRASNPWRVVTQKKAKSANQGISIRYRKFRFQLKTRKKKLHEKDNGYKYFNLDSYMDQGLGHGGLDDTFQLHEFKTHTKTIFRSNPRQERYSEITNNPSQRLIIWLASIIGTRTFFPKWCSC